MDKKVSFVAPNKPFFDRLDTFPIARLLKITLVPLVFGEIHYLLSLRTSLGRELTQDGLSSAQISPIVMQKSDPPLARGPMRICDRAGNNTTSACKLEAVCSGFRLK